MALVALPGLGKRCRLDGDHLAIWPLATAALRMISAISLALTLPLRVNAYVIRSSINLRTPLRRSKLVDIHIGESWNIRKRS